MEKAQAKLVDTIGRYNLSVNNISKMQFNVREEQLFCAMMQEFAEEYHTEQLRLSEVGVTLPDIYSGDLNKLRIETYKKLQELYNIENGSIRDIFNAGVDFYKKTIENTDEKLQHQLKMQKVREMKNPTILMNTKDLEAFIKQVEAQVNNFKVGTTPTYEGLPIIAKEHIEQGNIIIYDDVMRNYI